MGDEVASLKGARMVLSASGKKRITIAGPEGILWLGGQGANGSVVHAMKASDQNRAFGAVIGKALRAQATDTGLIPVLIALQ